MAIAPKPSTRDRSTRSVPLEDYALLSDLHTGLLVSRGGSIDWLCLPDFDSPSVFAALLGDAEEGRWLVEVVDGEVTDRQYRGATFILETTWRTPDGVAVVVDLLPPGDDHANLIRQVRCVAGRVVVRHDLRFRPDYDRAWMWLRRRELPEGAVGIVGVAGPEKVVLRGPLLAVRPAGDAIHRPLEAQGEAGPDLHGDFELNEGETLEWTLSWAKSYDDDPPATHVEEAIVATERYWLDWAAKLDHPTDKRSKLVERSLMVLRALTHSRTGGIVAALTTSLPEEFGGSRNWDYRYTWLRDAALTILALVDHGFTEGARAWRDWLLRAVAGDPSNVQIMYGLDGRRHLTEYELDHLPGYENSRPVRIGNGAVEQYQADVMGEVMIALAELRRAGEVDDEWSWGLQRNLLRFCVANLAVPDHGIWEMRGEPAFFTHGRVMMWAAFNEGLAAVEQYGDDPNHAVSATDEELQSWQRCRERLHDEIMTRGWNEELGCFVQTYSPAAAHAEVDASLLQLPQTGFIAADDPRMLSTVARIEQELIDEQGFIERYRTESGMDGLDGHEYPFLICQGWLAEQYAASGRLDDADRVLDLIESCATDLGLLAEEYDPKAGRLAGNFPQAFSHLGYVRAVAALRHARG